MTPWGGELQLSEDFLEKCFHCVQLVRSQVFEEKKMIDLDQQVRLEVPTRNKWDINLEKKCWFARTTKIVKDFLKGKLKCQDTQHS